MNKGEMYFPLSKRSSERCGMAFGNQVAMLVWLVLAALSSAAEPKVSFDRDIRPILSDKCFACHGPDASKRQAGLRLDVRDIAIKAADSGETAIVPGKSAASELLRRVSAADDAVLMPPPEAKRGRLTAEQIAKLQRWIDQGAEYQGHWSFLPLQPVAVPDQQTDFPAGVESRNGIDRIVQADRSGGPQAAESSATAGCRPRHPDPPCDIRPDRPAADGGRSPSICAR
jgi:hypothetical protein